MLPKYQRLACVFNSYSKILVWSLQLIRIDIARAVVFLPLISIPLAEVKKKKRYCSLNPILFNCAVGTSWWISDEAGVRSEAVPDSEWLSLSEWCHKSPKPTAQVTAGRVRQEAYLTSWWDCYWPVWVRRRILLLQVQVDSQLAFHLPSHPARCCCPRLSAHAFSHHLLLSQCTSYVRHQKNINLIIVGWI